MNKFCKVDADLNIEFENKFIMDRMNVMKFNNEKKALEYYEYMINKFKNI